MNDRKMLRKIFSGEEMSTEQVIHENYEAIYKYIYYHVGDKEKSQDLTQMVFLKFLEHMECYEEWGKLKNYLYVVAGNTIKDFHKKKQELLVESVPDEIQHTLQEQGPEERVLNQMYLTMALEELSEIEREIVILRYYQDLRLKEITQILQMPVSTVRYRLKQAKKQMQEKLNSKG